MIIGRKEKVKHNEKIYNVNYYNVRNTAWEFLIKNNVTFYPLDLHEILKQNNWKVTTYKQYSCSHHVELEELYKISTDGFTKVDENDDYVIVVNDINNRWRNRFTIAHEIGHIILHKTFKESSQLEKEANMFAARILMPMLLIKELNITTAEDLSQLCDVSIEAARYRLKRFNEIKWRERFYTNPYEIAVYDKLKNFINKRR